MIRDRCARPLIVRSCAHQARASSPTWLSPKIAVIRIVGLGAWRSAAILTGASGSICVDDYCLRQFPRNYRNGVWFSSRCEHVCLHLRLRCRSARLSLAIVAGRIGGYPEKSVSRLPVPRPKPTNMPPLSLWIAARISEGEIVLHINSLESLTKVKPKFVQGFYLALLKRRDYFPSTNLCEWQRQ
jgi:hypothetical protein